MLLIKVKLGLNQVNNEWGLRYEAWDEYVIELNQLVIDGYLTQLEADVLNDKAFEALKILEG